MCFSMFFLKIVIRYFCCANVPLSKSSYLTSNNEIKGSQHQTITFNTTSYSFYALTIETASQSVAPRAGAVGIF